MAKASRLACMLVLTLVAPTAAWAQLQVVPLPAAKQQAPSLRTGSQLNILPFWDDFSQEGAPRADHWEESAGVTISHRLPINPPSQGAAVFNGADSSGLPYSTDQLEIGQADQLVSCPFDLSTFSTTDNIRLAFYWQAQGFGEQPDAEDSLRLQGLNASGEWVTLWSAAFAGEQIRLTTWRTLVGVFGPSVTTYTLDAEAAQNPQIPLMDEFVQQVVRLDNDMFLHDGFQLRFQNFSRLTGSFDSWLVDYLFIDRRRPDGSFARQVTGQEVPFLDRTITQSQDHWLQRYRQVPAEHLAAANGAAPSFGFKNLDDDLQPIEYRQELVRLNDNAQLFFTDPPVLLAPTPQAYEQRTVAAAPPDFSGAADRDSVVVRHNIFIDSGDELLINQVIRSGGVPVDSTFFEHIDFRSNDTVSTDVLLQAAYAYDDGTAEFAAGVNQRGGSLAQRFETLQPDTLTALDIHWPRIGSSLEAAPITLKIWAEQDGLPGPVLFRRAEVSQPARNLDEFTRYQIPPMVVGTSFFIGFEQSVDYLLAVGLDRNTEAVDQVYFLVDERLGWQTTSDVTGTLMMRPVFERVEPGIVSGQHTSAVSLRLWPNPAGDRARLEGSFDSWTLTNLQGSTLGSGTSHELATGHLPPGMYLLRVSAAGQTQTLRLLKR